IEAAAALGYRTDIDPKVEVTEPSIVVDEGETQVTVPLDPAGSGAALVRFASTSLSPVTAVYVLLAIAAVAIAGILGTRIGAAFEADVHLATREVRRAGVADVMRGTIILHEARFKAMHDL